MVLYIVLIKYVASWSALRFNTYLMQGIWWPTFIAWICASLFDSPNVRKIFGYAVTISLGGPFFLYWVSIADMLIIANDSNLFTSWLWWVLFGVTLAFTIGSIFYEIIFVPKIYDWVQNAAIKKDNGSSDLADAINEAGDETLLASVDF